MANTLIPAKTGNFTASDTFAVCSAASENDSEVTTTTIGTGNTDSSTFTPTAITIDGIALKFFSRIASPGANTITVSLRNSTVPAQVDAITVNLSAISSQANGWYFFRFGSTHLLDATNLYFVRVTSSVASACTLYVLAGTNLTRQLRTTTTAAPGANDKLLLMGELTGTTGTSAWTVTMNNTATTIWGPTVSGGPPQGVSISDYSTLTFSTSIAAYFKYQGVFAVYAGGTLNIGTSGARIGASSSAILEMNSASNVDSGLNVFPGGTFNAYGDNARAVSSLMTADKAAAATVITVASTAGWSNTDVYAFASTTRTAADCESKTGATVDSATQITLAAGLTNAHSGTSPTQAEVVNLTRNVKIRGVSASLQGYCFFNSTAVVNVDYVEFTQLGSATSSKRGIEAQTTNGGTVSITHCSLHDSTVASSIGFNMATGLAGGSTLTFSNNVTFNIANVHYNITGAITATTWTLDSNVFIRNTDSGTNLVVLSDVGGTFTNNTMVGAASFGAVVVEANSPLGTHSGNTAHSNASVGMRFQNLLSGTISNYTGWRNGGVGLAIDSTSQGLTVATATLFGNTTSNLGLGVTNTVFTNLVLAGDTTFSTTQGVLLPSASTPAVGADLRMESCTFGVASGIFVAHTGSDIASSGGYCTITLRNCLLASTTEVSLQTSLPEGSYVRSQKHDQTAGNFKTWTRYGTLSVDTTIFDVVSPSVRLTPNDASNKLALDGGSVDGKGALRVPVASGGTATVSVRVRKSVVGDGTAYNGNLPRLILRKNVAGGIAADTAVATATVASSGAWETISGTSATVTDDCVLSFVVDCDGTTGWVNADNWVVSGHSLSLGMKFWNEGEPFAAAGSGGGKILRSSIIEGLGVLS